jgi:hypothetical protein
MVDPVSTWWQGETGDHLGHRLIVPAATQELLIAVLRGDSVAVSDPKEAS